MQSLRLVAHRAMLHRTPVLSRAIVRHKAAPRVFAAPMTRSFAAEAGEDAGEGQAEGETAEVEEGEEEVEVTEMKAIDAPWELPDKYKNINWDRLHRALSAADDDFFQEEYTYEDETPFGAEESHDVTESEMEQARSVIEHEKFVKMITHSCWIKTVGRRRLSQGGTIQSFSSLVIGGNEAGSAGFGIGRGPDGFKAWENAVTNLRKNMTHIELFEKRTLYQPIVGEFKTSKVVMIPLPRGRGNNVNSPIMKEILLCFGIEDVTTKLHGSRNPFNLVKAVWAGLSKNTSFRDKALQRGKNLYTMLEPRLVRPRYPTNQDMKQQRDIVGELLEGTEKKWQERQEQRAAVDQAMLELDDNQIPMFAAVGKSYPSVPPPQSRK